MIRIHPPRPRDLADLLELAGQPKVVWGTLIVPRGTLKGCVNGEGGVPSSW